MALIKLGGVVTQISGKIGGQTFGTSASGAYMKNSGTPRKSLTLSQRSKMSAMATTAQSWLALTQEHRDTFNAASPDYPYLKRVGETKFYSGYAIYTQLRNNALNVSFSGVPIPLPKFTFTPLSGGAIVGLPGLGHFVAGSAQTGVIYQLFTTRISSNGISFPYKNHFFISQFNTSVAPTLDIEFSSNYQDRFGNEPTSGKVYWRIDAVHQSTGQSFKGLASGVASY